MIGDRLRYTETISFPIWPLIGTTQGRFSINTGGIATLDAQFFLPFRKNDLNVIQEIAQFRNPSPPRIARDINHAGQTVT